MTIQMPQIDAAETATTSAPLSNQVNSDDSFEEKLKYEQARLGLFFSPFAQLPNMFGYLPMANHNFTGFDSSGGRTAPVSEAHYHSNNEQQANLTAAQAAKAQPAPAGEMMAQGNAASLAGQSLQDLLLKTNWLVPNLEASQQFYNSFLTGKLQPSFDLQSLVDQIADQLAVVKTKGKTELSLTLKPPELGSILLTLSYHQGLVSVSILAQAETKKLIDDNREELENALKKAHINFDEIQIKEVSNGRNV